MKNNKIIIGITLMLLILNLNPITNSRIIKNDYNLNFEAGFHLEIINNRIFLWKQPDISVPENGYPILFLLHGASQHAFAWFIGLNQWSKHQTTFTKKALERGFLIISSESLKPVKPGPRTWDVFNNGSNSKDIIYIENIIDWLKNSDLPVNTNRLYCAGFSSGAFMCSQIGHYFNNRFNAIAIHSGANSESISLTYLGPSFNLNTSYNFSSSFPPTIIIHGENDGFVPVQCAKNFYADLQRNKIPSKLLINQDEGHIWISQYDSEILDWLTTY